MLCREMVRVSESESEKSMLFPTAAKAFALDDDEMVKIISKQVS